MFFVSLLGVVFRIFFIFMAVGKFCRAVGKYFCFLGKVGEAVGNFVSVCG